MDRLNNAKVLIYSHDSFGLGHLRRCRAIANALVDAFKGMSVMIISGSPIISQFDFRSRVSFITVPGVVKLRNGDYTSLGLHVDLNETLAMRASIIQHAAEAFGPDAFIVDKEPLGLRGEIEYTLRWLRMKGCRNILGLRDIMDESEALQSEWERKEAVPAVENLYHEIWVYGTEATGNPVAGIDLSDRVLDRMHYLGYLRRDLSSNARIPERYSRQPYILVTPGGGGDGEVLVDWVIRAYESDTNGDLIHGIVIVGPFMKAKAQRDFKRRIARIPRLDFEVFTNRIEVLMKHAEGIVAMGGYNTFCEILSFDRRALLVPRETPRLEQKIRSDYALENGLASVLYHEHNANTGLMSEALHRLPRQPAPSLSASPGMLRGLDGIIDRIAILLKNS
ncbi:MAG: hypothetical protein F4Z15_05505 [Gammaproteobacteria bacterium]|nr:hypothetical protein [Gammaproteobacteria bacterium]MYD75418.1 hypothetical protein [Gammaproteobacteria bacterium]MYJ51720.1 hypothetical protein [Gammaproteobacteria bacterium]